MEFDRELLKILACPSCLGPLGAQSADEAGPELVCEACRVAYPVKDGIPDLLPESARTLDESDDNEA